MERFPVRSRNLSSVGYDEETSTLEIQFNAGHVYQFIGVPAYHFSGLMAAGSKGTYFDANIRKRHYSYRQVGGVG